MNFNLHPRQSTCFSSEATEILYGGACAGGKMLDLFTPIPTSTGFTLIKDLKIGDKVFNKEGQLTDIVAVHDVEETPNCYEVIFDTGESIKCDAGHLWITKDRKERLQEYRSTFEYKESRMRKYRSKNNLPDLKYNPRSEREVRIEGSIRTTKEILDTLVFKEKNGTTRLNHSIDICETLDLPQQKLPISPYLLGLWLGDGHSKTGVIGMLESDTAEVLNYVSEQVFSQKSVSSQKQPYIITRFKGLTSKLKGLKLLNNKRIPSIYLRSSKEQRLDLLKGIMDSDGHAHNRGNCILSQINKELIYDVHELISSLGIKSKISFKSLNKNNPNHSDLYIINFHSTTPVFKLKRKSQKQKLIISPKARRRFIVDVRPIPTIPMRCITVACDTGTYLVGKSFISTHNSYCMRSIAIYYAVAVPGIQIYLFRRLSEDLKKNHLDGDGGFIKLLSEFLDRKSCKINYSTGQIVFWNGSKIHLCHCQHEKDVIKYQGVEINLLLIDELTHFTSYIYNFLRGRVRLGSLKVPDGVIGNLPKIICSSNPGGIGHDFVKSMFIDDYDPMDLYQMPPEDGGMIRQFIPAKLSDNPTMLENDPHYATKLIGLGGALAKALLEGDWDAIEGAYFDTFNKDLHVIDDFIIPAHWNRIRAFDWGYSAPFCCLWGAVSDGQLIDIGSQQIYIPKDAIVIYREYYGWTGKPNEGIKLNAEEIAKEIAKMQQGEEINDQVADPAIFDVSVGTSIAEQMNKHGIFWRPADNKRVAGWQQIRSRLKGIDGKPLLYIMSCCKSLIRTLPIMQYNKTKPEDLDTSLEDHGVDTLRYLAMSRPITIEADKQLPEIAKQWWKDFNPTTIRKHGGMDQK